MMMPDDGHAIGINYWLCLPKAVLETKNSTWVFGFQLDSIEKHLLTLAVPTFTHFNLPIFFKESRKYNHLQIRIFYSIKDITTHQIGTDIKNLPI